MGIRKASSARKHMSHSKFYCCYCVCSRNIHYNYSLFAPTSEGARKTAVATLRPAVLGKYMRYASSRRLPPWGVTSTA